MSFNTTTLRKMIAAAKEKIEANVEYLNQLDSATGDGDHGTAIITAMQAAEKATETDASLKEMLSAISSAIMSETSGSTSTLTGLFYSGMSKAIESEELNPDALIGMFESGLKRVQTASKAQVGDKTLMDAMIPAVEALSGIKGAGKNGTEVLKTAAEAAKSGAESTKDMIAKHGRARNLGERSKGHLDAGACSLAMILEAFAESF